jgi:5-methyltetrahydrofolate--homocysteine methyltransferase
MSTHRRGVPGNAACCLVGERLNAQGSRLARRLLTSEDYDALVTLGREQIAHGAHALDVCVTIPEDDREAERMVTLVTRLMNAVDVPLFIDSAQPHVLSAALPSAGARGVANSITLASGSRDADSLVPLVRDLDARLVGLCIDERGMATAAADKLDVARRLHHIIVDNHGLARDALIIDVLTLPLGKNRPAHRRAAVETLAALRRIKEALPGVQTLLGISDVSFGLRPEARRVLNAVFLHHCVNAGLDLAIVNVGERRAYETLQDEERERAEDLIFDRREDALERFTDRINAQVTIQNSQITKRPAAE